MVQSVIASGSGTSGEEMASSNHFLNCAMGEGESVLPSIPSDWYWLCDSTLATASPLLPPVEYVAILREGAVVSGRRREQDKSGCSWRSVCWTEIIS